MGYFYNQRINWSRKNACPFREGLIKREGVNFKNCEENLQKLQYISVIKNSKYVKQECFKLKGLSDVTLFARTFHIFPFVYLMKK